jgi:hypothetical protein
MPKRILAPCPAPQCNRLGSFAHGLCPEHWRDWRDECIRNGSWQRTSNHASLVPSPVNTQTPWEYEGDEQALIDAVEAQEREQRESPIQQE